MHIESETIEELAEKLNVSVGSLDPKMASAIVIHGEELKELNDEDLDDVIRYNLIFTF